jgi:hypothetical protein
MSRRTIHGHSFANRTNPSEARVTASCADSSGSRLVARVARAGGQRRPIHRSTDWQKPVLAKRVREDYELLRTEYAISQDMGAPHGLYEGRPNLRQRLYKAAHPA